MEPAAPTRWSLRHVALGALILGSLIAGLAAWSLRPTLQTNSPAAVAPPPLAAADVLPFEPLSIPDPTPTAEADAPGLTVQVAAVRNAATAAALADRLVDSGFPAYVAPAADASDNLHRVRVGRSLVRPEAEKLAARLSEEQQLDAYLVGHD